MEMIEGCGCKVKRTRLVRIVDWLCGALLIGITLWVVCHYAALPDRIPIHYNAGGAIDRYGNKSMIWVLMACMWAPVGILSAVECFPRFWNVPFKVTMENHSRMMTLTWFVCVCGYNVHAGRKPVGVVHADNVNGTLCEFFVLGRSTFSGKIKHG